MLLKKTVVLITIFLGLAASPSFTQAAGDPNKPDLGKIKKCQDTTGKWHYGDSAANECAQSKIIVITEQGTKTREIAAPLTPAELKERELKKAEIEAAQQRQEDQTRKDSLLLSTYSSESDIAYIRDRKIAQVEASIRASEDTLKSLRAGLDRMESQGSDELNAKAVGQTQQQIAKHDEAIAAKRHEQEALRKQYAAELERYRELRSGSVKTDTAAKK